LLDRVEPFCGNGWTRPQLRRLAQDALDALWDFDGSLQKFIPNDNEGFPPYLITSSDTVEYEITAANLSCAAISQKIGGTTYNVRALRALKVFTDVTQYKYDYDKRWLGRPYIYYGQNPYSSARTRLAVSDVPIRSYPAMEGQNAKIIFLEPPNTSSTEYFIEFIWEPPRLASDAIKLPIPTRFEQAIEDYVLGFVQGRASGAGSPLLEKFEGYWKPEFQQVYSVNGAQPTENETTLRTC
jgi:hypothetical protein